jgi:F0F1-type ATP synthase membrane subunit b/b'
LAVGSLGGRLGRKNGEFSRTRARIILLLLLTILILLQWIPDALDPWLNYPGLELWKFANLVIFVVCAAYLHRRFGRPVREALRSRGERIKHDLAKAREERDLALAKLAEVEARFTDLDAEVIAIREKAKLEGEAERDRIKLATEEEISRIREQAKREIESAGKAARQELRRFAATESVRLAEEILKGEIGPDDDARLTSKSVQELGRIGV